MDLFVNVVITVLALGTGLGLLVLLGFALFLLLALALAGPKGFAQKYREVRAEHEAERVLAAVKAAAKAVEPPEATAAEKWKPPGGRRGSGGGLVN